MPFRTVCQQYLICAFWFCLSLAVILLCSERIIQFKAHDATLHTFSIDYQRRVVDNVGEISWNQSEIQKIVNLIYTQPEATCACNYTSGQGYAYDCGMNFLPWNLTRLLRLTPYEWCVTLFTHPDSMSVEQCLLFDSLLTRSVNLDIFVVTDNLLARGDDWVRILLERFKSTCLDLIRSGSVTTNQTLIPFWNTLLDSGYFYCLDVPSFDQLYLEPPWRQSFPEPPLAIYYDYQKDSLFGKGSEFDFIDGTTFYSYYVARCNPSTCIVPRSTLCNDKVMLVWAALMFGSLSLSLVLAWSAMIVWKHLHLPRSSSQSQ